MDSSNTRRSSSRVPYQHQTWNHLFFDRIREVQLEIRLMQSYLFEEDASREGGAYLSSEIDALDRCSTILFEAVYKSLRSKWL